MRRLSFVASLLLLHAVSALADGPTDPPDKGGTRPEALSLPTGPGSLAGMGEQVSAEPATGALTLNVPIQLPPAPAGVEPQLALHYDSRQGNGPLGIGWSIGVPSIERRTELGLPHYDSTDTLLFDGQRLIQVAPGIYRPRVEGALVRITALASGFQVELKDGSKLLLGSSAASQVADGNQVFRWLTERVTSVHGDLATYSYLADGAQRYLAEIDYGRSSGPAARVTFRYGTRPDSIPGARPGFLLPAAKRLLEIDTFVDGATGVRSTVLGYDDSSGLSRLASAQTCSADGSACLPKLTFTVSAPDFSQAQLLSLTAPGSWLGDPDTALLDVDGDSLPDVVQVTSLGTTWWKNLGPAGFAAGQPIAGAPGVELATPGAALQDMDGDGYADLLFALGSNGEDGLSYVPFTMTASGAEVATPVDLIGPSGLPPSGPDVRWLDLDGDGRVDALQAARDGWTAWYNLGGGKLSAPVSVIPPVTGLSFEDPTLRLCDMNGDGLVDLVQLQSGSATVYLNLGFGRFAAPQTLAGAPDVGGDDLRLYLGDADGDGLADVFYVAPGRVSIWRNLSGLAFGPEIVVASAPDYDPTTTTVRVADLLAHGQRGIVYAGGEQGQAFLWFLDPTSGVHPNLLTALDNGVGGTRVLGYRSTGELMATASAQGLPFSSATPFPVEVLTTLLLGDAESPPQALDYFYRDPYWDPRERRFEGFATSQSTDPGDVHAAGLQTVTTFHTGRGEELCLAGKAQVQEERTLSGSLLHRSSTRWQPLIVAAGLSGESATLALATEEIDEQWDGSAVAARRRVRRTFDLHGNTVAEDDDGWLGAAPDPARISVRSSYADDEGPWILGKLAERVVRDASGAVTQDERDYYDGPSFVGLALGQLTAGEPTRKSAWVLGSQFIDLERYQRDGYGNPIVILDADGRRTEVDFDSLRNLFPVEERHFPSPGVTLTWDSVVDPATGQALSLRGPDGSITDYGRDGLGRLVTVTRPTDPPGLPGEQRQYVMTPGTRQLIRSLRSEPGGAFDVVQIDLFDGQLRPLAHAETAEVPGQYAISHRIARDARGAQAELFVPYFAATPDAPPPGGQAATTDFRDPLGRVVHRLLPAGGELLWVFQPGLVDSYDSMASQGQGEVERHLLDWRGKIASVILDPGASDQRSFTFQRDPGGNVVLRRTPLGATATARYDGLERLVALVDPDAQTVGVSYDGAGHPIARVDGNGQVSYAYDGVGRILSESDGAGGVSRYCYDDPVGCGAGSASPGRLLFVRDRSGTSAFTYDRDGRLTSTEISQQGHDLTTRFGYDGADRVNWIGYPDGQDLTFGFGGRQLVTVIPGLLSAATYSAGGQPLTRSFANGVAEQLTRDAGDRITEVSASEGQASLVAASYTLLPSGAPSQRVDSAGTTSFTLDGAERLAAERGPSGHRQQVFDQDERLVGRWATPPDSRLPGQSLLYGVGAGPHALAASARGPIGYDVVGARLTDGDRTLAWDAEGQLAAVQAPGVSAAYSYGFDGQRRSRTVLRVDGRQTSALAFGDLVELRDGVLWEHVVLGAERIATLLGNP